ncbi:Multicopper oxidase [Musa troglodytarum]|uniref:Multicopper oxidase n=1 Tax=Musa troglodytarum TaxID=320322 RepID=A0A9E7ETY3_9LILI|nr:Multicopper oxidase [Musa troglodytarum]
MDACSERSMVDQGPRGHADYVRGKKPSAAQASWREPTASPCLEAALSSYNISNVQNEPGVKFEDHHGLVGERTATALFFLLCVCERVRNSVATLRLLFPIWLPNRFRLNCDWVTRDIWGKKVRAGADGSSNCRDMLPVVAAVAHQLPDAVPRRLPCGGPVPRLQQAAAFGRPCPRLRPRLALPRGRLGQTVVGPFAGHAEEAR